MALDCCLDAIKSLLGSQSMVASITLPTIIFTLVALHFYYRNLYTFWHKRNLKGPKPWPVVGNLVQVIFSNRMLQERDWAQKYGKVYGSFHGSKPRLNIADPDVLRQICIKDFDVFPNHEPMEFNNKYQKRFILFLQDEHWKRVRAMLSPTFTSIKIKRMFKLLEACADDLIECFNEQFTSKQATETIVNAKDTFALYTMDAIASCCYGLKLEREAGSSDVKSAASRNEFVAIGMRIFETDWLRMVASFTVPRPILKFFGFELTSEKVVDPLAHRVEKLIGSRRKSAKKFDDYLQLLLDAKFNDELHLNEMDRHENHHAGLTEQSLVQDQTKLISDVESRKANGNSVSSNLNKIELSDQEILANAVFLLMVGLETTATLLAHCAYALAFHQDCQAKLYETLDGIAERQVSVDGEGTKTTAFVFDYEKLTSCQYLDAVISETLRCLSPVLMLDRIGNRDYKIEKYNVLVPRGTKLHLAYYAIMNDPDYWPQPDKFDPERFMPGQRENIYPGSYCPFGIGPRHCLGMRFSLTESKLALAKILMQFKFEPAPRTTFPPRPKMTYVLNGIENPSVRVIRRK